MDEYILVIDSGLGGISVLNSCIKIMPNENFLYVADIKNAPYGNKNKKRLQKQAYNTVNFFLNNYKIKLILFACNTLTATAINFVRSRVDLPIVGIEPAIKAAVKNANNNILLISTKATLKYNKMLISYKKQKLNNVYYVPLKKLAKKIDNNLKDLNKIQSYINKILKRFANKNINSVVLGCTHYSFIKEQIKSSLNKSNLLFFESNEGTVKRVKYLLEQNYNLKTQGKSIIKIRCTKSNKLMEIKLKNYIY